MTCVRRQTLGFCRAARKIHARYEATRRMQHLLIDASRSSIEIARTRRLVRVTEQKGWKLAEQFVRTRLARQLHQYRSQLDSTIGQLETQKVYLASEAEIVRDLIALGEEFEQVRFDARDDRLIVTTLPIELEGTWLGPFAVGLDLKSLSTISKGYYDVIALDPCPSRTRDDVTHPHVQSGELCEGEAQTAITNALKQGRLLDFFQIVHGVLGTYNSSSPYVSLDDWNALRCNDCGDTHSPDDGYICGQCDDSICSGCQSICTTCSEIVCGSCSKRCESCQESVCEKCVQECTDCDNHTCNDCLTEKRCKSCAKETEEAESEDESGQSPIQQHPLPEVHADGMGQTAVLA